MAERKSYQNSYGNNYARNREPTRFDTLDLASELKHKVSIYVMNDKRVSKHWRYMNGKPAIDYVRMIRDFISRANDIELVESKASERKQLQEQALSYCNVLQLQLMDIIAECEEIGRASCRERV